MQLRIDELPLDELPIDALWTLRLSDLTFSGQVLLGALILTSYAGLLDAASWLHQPLLSPRNRVLIQKAGTREAYRWARLYFGIACVTWWCGC